MAWDRCSDGLQGLSREQVNPNHLMIDMNGEPVTGDGFDKSAIRLFADAAVERTVEALAPVERDMVIRQYGSLDA